ncbi:MAG: hypothetical protein ChlgKO_09010 [Chlamydiales bacterium]
MKNFNDEAISIAKWINGSDKLDHFTNTQPRKRLFLHLPGSFLRQLFAHEKKAHKPNPSKTTEKSDGRAVKLWESQDYPLWELKEIAKEGNIQNYQITYVQPLGKIEEQSKNISINRKTNSSHSYILLPKKPKISPPPPEHYRPNRATDSRMRVSKL